VSALEGHRIIEFAAIGPVPLCGLMLADHGADVIRIDRPGGSGALPAEMLDVATRGRRSIAVDLKQPAGVALAVDLAATADAIVEGHRPGVMERLGLGPDVLLERNPRLVYGRMTGWGQDGPMAAMAGHDINYIGLVGALHAIGTSDAPVPPLNLVGDYGGGAMLLAFGVLAALLERHRSGRGQVVDAAMIDGAALLMAPTFGLLGAGIWRDTRAANTLDGGAPFYGVYRCADGEWIAVGALEPQFHAELMQRLGLPDEPDRLDPAHWQAQRERLADVFAERPRQAWVELFDGSDACVTQVLAMTEAPGHPHNVARDVFVPVGDRSEPAPAPRFSRSAASVPTPGPRVGADTDAVLESMGISGADIAMLRSRGVVH
jgi:alpha-methylacyl-CoA racemase